MELKLLLIGIPKTWCEGILESGTTVETRSILAGLPHLEYDFYLHISTHNIIKYAVEGEKDGFDAILIGCFDDPGLREVRELVKIPVIGAGEATLHAASMLVAGKFSVLVGRKKWIPALADNARIYGFDSKIASWRVLELTLPDMRDQEKTYPSIVREGKTAVEEDQAEAICLGCTGLVGHAQRAQEAIGVPVLDPVLIGLKMAEFRAMLWKKFAISHSKVGGYEPPPHDEFAEIYRATYGGIKRLFFRKP